MTISVISEGKSSLASLLLTYSKCIAYIKRTMGKQHVKIILILLKWDNYFESIGGLVSPLALYVCCFLTRQSPKRLRRQEPRQGISERSLAVHSARGEGRRCPAWGGLMRDGVITLRGEEPCAFFLPISPSILWVSGNSRLPPVVGVWASEANTSSATLVCRGLYTSSCEKNPIFLLGSWGFAEITVKGTQQDEGRNAGVRKGHSSKLIKQGHSWGSFHLFFYLSKLNLVKFANILLLKIRQQNLVPWAKPHACTKRCPSIHVKAHLNRIGNIIFSL